VTDKRDIGYVSARGDPVETGFKPSVEACSKRKCPELKEEVYQGIRRKICSINDRIPGNLGKCPKEAQA